MKKSMKGKLMRLCAGVLIISCISIFLRAGTDQILVKKMHLSNVITNTILGDDIEIGPSRKQEPSIAWEEKYPFAEKEDTEQATVTSKRQVPFMWLSGGIQKIQNGVKKWQGKIEPWTENHFWQYTELIRISNAYQKAIGWDIAPLHGYNSVVTLPDGQLVAFNPKTDVSRKIQSITTFANECNRLGIHFVMVLAPSKIARSETDYAGKLDFSNQNGDAFIQGLKENQIPCLDLRDGIEREGLDQHALFYRTDHHWTGATARWATGYLFDYLNEKCGYHANRALLASEEYEEVVYPSVFLGSRGMKLTLARCTPDDFSLYYPKFDTSFHLAIPSIDLDQRGSFDILYDMACLDFEKSYYQRWAYSTYAYGLRALISIRNEQKQDGKKLLLVRDFFANAMTPFLALGMERLDTIDLSYFTGSLQTYIQTERPDTVVVMYFIEALTERDDLPVHTGLFDFR